MQTGSRRNNNNNNSNSNRPYQLKSNKRLSGERLQQHQISKKEYDEGALDLESNFVNSGSRNCLELPLLNSNATKDASTTASLATNTNVDKNIISPPTPSKKRKVYTDVVNPLSDRYENVFCVRKGDYSCIYFVQDKVTKQVCFFCSLLVLIVRICQSKKCPRRRRAKNMNLRKSSIRHPIPTS